MAASQAVLILSLCTFLFSSTPARALPAPAPPPLNLVDTLQKAGQYSTLIPLLGSTKVGDQLAYQLNDFSKATFFAPTDAAFNSLPSGFLNAMTMEQQVKLLNFHVVPHFFTWNDFKNGVPPQNTQASGPDGPYVLTFTFVSDQHVNVSTGLMDTIFSNALNLTPPLAIYQVDKVLIPPGMFGPSSKPATGSASAPSSTASPSSSSAPSSTASPSSSSAPSSSHQPPAPSSSSSPPPSTPSPSSSSAPAPPSKSAPRPTGPHPSAPASTGSAPASTSTETGSAPAAGALGPWSLMGSLMAAAVAAMV